MATLPLLKAAGLHTAANFFSTTPDGGLRVARNVVIRETNVIEPRKGQGPLTDELEISSNVAAFFDDVLIIHCGDSTLESYTDDNGFFPYANSYTPADDSLMRMKFVESVDKMFFNTDAGIYVIDEWTSEPRAAGIRAPMVSYANGYQDFGTGAYLPAGNQVAFRGTFGYYNSSGGFVESPPSDRVVYINEAVSPGPVYTYIEFNGQEDLPSGYYFRLYATDLSGGEAIDPQDEMYLIYEQALSAGGPAVIVTTDIYSLSNTQLYTNARTGDSILASNYPPPATKDLTEFNHVMWYANGRTYQTYSLSLIGVGAPSGLQSGDTITIGDQTFTADAAGDYSFATSSGGTASENIETTAKSLADAINYVGGSRLSRHFRAHYRSGSDDPPGMLVIEREDLGDDSEFAVSSSRSTCWNPVLPATAGSEVSSDNNLPNGVFYSKEDQPEAVPLLNYILVGKKNKEILRILGLRDKLFVFKDDGVFTISGDAPYRVDLLDKSVRLVCPDSAVVLNNQIFCFTTKGICAVSDTGVQILSRPIEDQLLPYLRPDSQGIIKRRGFGVPRERDHEYELWLPTLGLQSDDDCRAAFVFNTLTNTWVTTDRKRNWGAVSKTDEVYYGATGTLVYRERNEGTQSDYVDESVYGFSLTFDPVSIGLTADGKGFLFSFFPQISSTNVVVGDYLYLLNNANNWERHLITTVTNTYFSTDVVLTYTDAITIEIQKAIDCEVKWNPVSGGQPGLLKSFTFGTFHFAQATFSTGYANYVSDYSAGLSSELLTVNSTSSGWGNFAWGGPWGGNNVVLNSRHVIPLEKHTCTALVPSFTVREAGAYWRLLGLTLETDATSERTGL